MLCLTLFLDTWNMCLCCVAPSNTKAVAFADLKNILMHWSTYLLDHVQPVYHFKAVVCLEKWNHVWFAEVWLQSSWCRLVMFQLGVLFICNSLPSTFIHVDLWQLPGVSTIKLIQVGHVSSVYVLSNVAIHCNLLWFILICDNCQVLQLKNIQNYCNTIQINLTVVW